MDRNLQFWSPISKFWSPGQNFGHPEKPGREESIDSLEDCTSIIFLDHWTRLGEALNRAISELLRFGKT